MTALSRPSVAQCLSDPGSVVKRERYTEPENLAGLYETLTKWQERALREAGWLVPEHEPYVLVTLASNGVKHAWGPFETRQKADVVRQRWTRGGRLEGVQVMTLRVLNPDDGDLMPLDVVSRTQSHGQVTG